MSTMEHLFMQIFERKKWIEDQLRQQIESHVQSLAYNLLADGGRPPPWLWTMESAEPGGPDLEGLEREQLISGILFPHLWATTPSMNHNNLYPVPALKGTNVSQPNSFFSEMCVSNQNIYAGPSDEAVPNNFLKDSERDSDIIGLKAVEANVGFDPLARIQRSRSRQRDLENRLSKKAKITCFGDESTIDQYSGRMTRSRVASLRPDNVKETSVMKNSLSFNNVDGDRATRSRRASQKLGSLRKLSKPAEHLKPVEYGAQKAVEDQMDFWPAMSSNMETLEVNNVDDAMAPQRCATRTAVEGLAALSDASSPINSGMKVTCTAARELPQTHSLVDAKKFLFDGIEVCGSNDNLVTAFEKENQEYTSEVTPLKMGMQSLKEDSFCRDSMNTHGSLACKKPQDDVLRTGGVMQKTEEADRFSHECAMENQKFVEVDDLECHSHPSSCKKKPSQTPIQLSLKPTHCIFENEPTHPSLMRDPMLNYSKNISGQQSVPHDCSSESSSGRLGKHKLEEQCSVPLVDLPTIIVASRQSMTNSLVEPKHHLLDGKKQIDLDCNSIASLGKESKGGNSERDTKLDTVLSIKEELFHRASKTAHVSPAIVQIQEEVVLPALEGMRSIDEINRVSGDVHEEISELPGMVNPKHNSQFINCDDIPSQISAMSALEVMSGGVAGEKHSMDSPVKCPTDENCEGLLIKEPNDSLINPIDTPLSVGPALLFSEMDDIYIEAEEAETTAVQLGKTSVATPISMSDAAENHDVEVECQHMPTSSTLSNKIIGSCQSNNSVLVSSNKAGECFSAQETVINAGTRDVEEKLLVREMPIMAEAHNAGTCYYLRSSVSLDKTFGSSVVNAFSVPCPDKISMQLEAIKNDIYGGAKDVAEKNVIHHLETPNNTEAQIAAPEARYFLRSLTNQQKRLGSCRGTNDARSLKQKSMETVAPACEISWPKRRKIEGRSNNIVATSPRMRFKPFLHVQKGSGGRSEINSENALGDGMELKSSPLPSKLKSEIANAVLESPLKVLHGSKKLCVTGDVSCLKADERTMVSPLQIEHGQRVAFHDLADGISGTCLTNKGGASEMSDFNLQESCISKDCHDLTHSESILPDKIPKSPDYYVEFTEERKICDTEGGFYAYDSARLSQCHVDMADYDEAMPEFEGFSIGVPSVIEDGDFYNDIPSLTKERDSVLGQLCNSRNLVTPSSPLSTKYKINRLPDIYQSIPAGILEHMKSSDPHHFDNVDMKQFRESEDENFSSLFNLELEHDGSINGKFHSHSMPSSSARFGWLTSKPPLTPPVEKSSQKKFWGRSGASSETVGSNPELVCFRIDENISTTEENENPDGLDMSKVRVGSREIKMSTNREGLLDVTAVYHNAPSLVSVSKFAERGSLESLNTESYSGAQKGVHSIVGNACARKPKMVDKEKHSLPVNGNRVRKASESISSRSSKPEISGKAEDGNKSRTHLGKGCKANNTVSDISSFVPLVQQKKQAATAKGKRGIKVKALEAAEAAKRLEEKKQNERKMRKAAVKVERARLEQEKELKQRQKEEERKKKKEVAARKRQREEEERKERERKRRCIDEARKLQREQEEKICAEKEERELRHNAEAEKERRKNELMEQANRQLKSEKEGEHAGCRKPADLEADTTEVVVSERKHGNSNFAGPNASKELNDIEKSFDMSPYRDSEVEDDDAEEEIRRKRKYIPSWARRECLDQILLSNQHLDPTEIFCRKSSFDLNEVLPRTLRLPS